MAITSTFSMLSIGSMVLQIQGISGKYGVTSFSLDKTINAVTSLDVRLSAGVSIASSQSQDQIPTLSEVYTLYRSKRKLLKMRMVELEAGGTAEKRTWFSGYIVAILPVYQAGMSSVSDLSIRCMHSVVLMQTSPMAQYQYSVGSVMTSLIELDLRKDVNKNTQSTNYGRSDSISTDGIYILGQTPLNTSDTVLKNAASIVNAIQAVATGIQGMTTQRKTGVGIDITDYIKGDFYLAQAFRTLTDKGMECPYYKDIMDQLLSGISQGTVWDALVACFTGSERLIQFIPPSLKDLESTEVDKYTMAPKAFWPQVQKAAATVTVESLAALQMQCDTAIVLSRPDMFVVNFSQLIDWGDGRITSSPNNSIYEYTGIYAPDNILSEARAQSSSSLNASRLFKVRNVQAPAWLLKTAVRDTVAQAAGKDKAGPVANNSNLTESQANKLAGEKIVAQVAQVKSKYLDPYAKALFCALYNGGNKARLSLFPTQGNLSLDQHLGSTIKVDMTGSLLSDSSLLSCAGVMTSYRVAYTASAGDSSTQLQLSVSLDNVRQLTDSAAVSCPLYTTTGGVKPETVEAIAAASPVSQTAQADQADGTNAYNMQQAKNAYNQRNSGTTA